MGSGIPEIGSAELADLQPRASRVGLLHDYLALGEEAVEFRSRQAAEKRSCSSELMVEGSMIEPFLWVCICGELLLHVVVRKLTATSSGRRFSPSAAAPGFQA